MGSRLESIRFSKMRNSIIFFCTRVQKKMNRFYPSLNLVEVEYYSVESRVKIRSKSSKIRFESSIIFWTKNFFSLKIPQKMFLTKKIIFYQKTFFFKKKKKKKKKS